MSNYDPNRKPSVDVENYGPNRKSADPIKDRVTFVDLVTPKDGADVFVHLETLRRFTEQGWILCGVIANGKSYRPEPNDGLLHPSQASDPVTRFYFQRTEPR